jgi:DNA-directed RNA polymerase subunit E'/Rpb7
VISLHKFASRFHTPLIFFVIHFRERVRTELLGSSLGKHGYVIEIIEIKDEDIIVGLIDNDSGAVNITAWYNAILLRPFPNEILDSIVTNTNEVPH